ncbi:MAG: putative Ig domain-containing protein, partial [Bryobacterales bacterium]|nr:putative Ig domain-containing protein [Bryobacterales bacterium]
CTVTLSKAVSSNTVVSLSSNSTSLSVPASITVVSGQSSASFLAQAGSVTSNQSVMISALSGGSSVNATVIVTAPTASTGGLIAAYSFNEGSGTILNDLSGNGNNGMIYGATWTTKGKYGGALSFNGINSYVDLGNPASLQLTGSMTLSAWVYIVGNPPDDGQIIAKSDNTGGWQLKTSPDTGVRTFGLMTSSNNSTPVQRYSSLRPAAKRWYHVAGVYNASAKTMNLYVNGSLVNGTLWGTIPAAQFNNSAQNVVIGRRWGGYYFNGMIDELRVYNRALGQSEIKKDMGRAVTAAASTISMVVSGEQTSVAGDPVTLHVAASDQAQEAVTLSVSDLPTGARFDGSSGEFFWEPGNTAPGSYPVTFRAINSRGHLETLRVPVEVAPGIPVLESLHSSTTGAAGQFCSPGGLVTLGGTGLSRAGDEIQVLVNGGEVSVVRSTRKRILFECPNVPAGTPLTVQLRRGAQWSNTLDSVMMEAAPGIFPLDSEEITVPGGATPTVSSGEVVVLATGLGMEAAQNPGRIHAIAGDAVIPATSVTAVAPGIWRVTLRTADGSVWNGASLRLAVRLNNGRVVESNTVNVVPEGRGSEAR